MAQVAADGSIVYLDPTWHWNAHLVKLRLCYGCSGKSMTYGEVLAHLQAADLGIVQLLQQAMTYLDSQAVYFETPPVSVATLSQPFECVLVHAPELHQAAACPDAFGSHVLAISGPSVVAFDNLSQTSRLVAPVCRTVPASAHMAHLKCYLTSASLKDQQDLWRTVAIEMGRAMKGDETVWLSTHGRGVPWLHVRLDTEPRYYTYGPYTDECARV